MMSKTQAYFFSYEEYDVINSYFECVTACSLANEGLECITQCVATYLKDEVK